MMRRPLILLSLCATVLAGFIAYLSNQAMEDTRIAKERVTEVSCMEMLKAPPTETTGLVIDDFVLGRHLAEIDYNHDGRWDAIAIPLFPNRNQPIKHGYRAVIACCKGIPDMEALDRQMLARPIEAAYWPGRQTLDVNVHSHLAMKYRHMDFSHSPVIHVGYDQASPILGETSFRLSIMMGAVSFLIALAALVAEAATAIFGGTLQPRQRLRARTNRAGLPSRAVPDAEMAVGVLDRVRSMRDTNSVA